MTQNSLGELVLQNRTEKGFTQEELASLCELDTRTIQRIEKGEVTPYFSTLKILSRVLDFDFISAINTKPWKFSDKEIALYHKKFKKKRTIRIAISITFIILMLGAAATFPTFRLFGMSKLTWAPFLYLIFFGLLIAIGFTWRCPACKAQLGNPFNTQFCPGCGIKFKN